MTTTQKWLYGLASTVINGIASGIVLVVVSPETFNFAEGWRQLVTACFALGLLGMANYLKSSPLPSWEGTQRGLALVLAAGLALPVVGCGGGEPPSLRPAAIASETFSVALKGLQTQFVQWSDAGLIARADERRWQGVFRTMAQAGLAVDAAIAAGDRKSILDNANALATLAETLMTQEIVKLPASQQAIVRTAIVSLRGFVAIWQAIQTPVAANLGDPYDLRAVLATASTRVYAEGN